MRNATNLFSLLALVLTAGLFAGCHTGPRVDDRDLQPIRDTAGEPRSLAFASPQQRQAVVEAGFPPDLPWYVERNDHRPFAEAGQRATTVEQSVTYTTDYLRTIRGRVLDTYHETRHRQRVRETWR